MKTGSMFQIGGMIDGGPCRIRTHVSGSEGRKDIQTTLIARSLPDRQPLLEEVC